MSRARMQAGVAPDRFERWMVLLQFLHPTPRNRDLLIAFFLRQFEEVPSDLASFLVYLRRCLRSPASPALCQKIAAGYLAVLSPLCERFGFYVEKTELDDRCFKIASAGHYREAQKMLQSYERRSRTVLRRILAVLRRLLRTEGYACEVHGRFKSVVSIYRKLQLKRYGSPLALHDIFAFRIVLMGENTAACYDVLNLLHDHFSPIPDRFKDYIAIPKTNGYQSIHTCLNHVLPDLDLPVEIQIRTQGMDEFAERGFASHWLYSREKRSHAVTDLDHRLAGRPMAPLHIAATTVTCLTPRGDVLVLPQGATTLDFAYRVHTHVGRCFASAIVNGAPRDIGYQLRDGDRVEVVRAKRPQVRHDWLQVAHLPSTRRKIHASL